MNGLIEEEPVCHLVLSIIGWECVSVELMVCV